MCSACWNSAGRHTRDDDDDDEVQKALESIAAVGIGVALGGDPVTEAATEVATRAAAPVVEEVADVVSDTVSDLLDW